MNIVQIHDENTNTNTMIRTASLEDGDGQQLISIIQFDLKRHRTILVRKIGLMCWVRIWLQYRSFNTISISTDIRTFDSIDYCRCHNVCQKAFDAILSCRWDQLTFIGLLDGVRRCRWCCYAYTDRGEEHEQRQDIESNRWEIGAHSVRRRSNVWLWSTDR